jgi:hypothetical protein
METSGKSPFNVPVGNVVAAMRDTLSYTQFSHFHTGQSQINQLHLPPGVSNAPDQFQIASSRQRGFKRKVFQLSDARIDLF